LREYVKVICEVYGKIKKYIFIILRTASFGEESKVIYKIQQAFTIKLSMTEWLWQHDE